MQAYDQAKNYRLIQMDVNGIEDLYESLLALSNQYSRCVIRGEPSGSVEGPITRTLDAFGDAPRKWLMLDVDQAEIPEGMAFQDAIQDFIARYLPPEFQAASYVWQLSSSFGAPGKEHLLKAHLWFWLERAYTSSEVKTWATIKGLPVDRGVFNPVQIHYTARPYIEGAKDPVPVRVGFVEGWEDAVPLVIEPGVLAAAPALGGVIELSNPRDKKGAIGAFCRAFEMEEVMDRWLSDVFEFSGDSTRRLNFLQSASGMEGGAFITDDREHIVNTHDSDPLDRRAVNKWDLVRHYVFGHLDETDDPFDGQGAVQNRPSHLAMESMALELPEVQAELEARAAPEYQEGSTEVVILPPERDHAKVDARKEAHIAAIRAAPNLTTLADMAVGIRRDPLIQQVERIPIIAAYRARAEELGQALSMADAKSLLVPKKADIEAAVQAANAAVPSTGSDWAPIAVPEWARQFAWVVSKDCFIHLGHKQTYSLTSFDMTFARHRDDLRMVVFGEEIVNLPSTMVRSFWGVPVVHGIRYNPAAQAVFQEDGALWANSFRLDQVVKPAETYTKKGIEWLKLFLGHIRKFSGKRRRVARLFTAWLAFNYRNPGKKVRWAPLLIGMEGDGKTIFSKAMACLLGHGNVKSVSASTIQNSSFTGYLGSSCMTFIEEVRFHGHNRYDVPNRLKEPVSNDRVEIHPKGQDPYNAGNFTNFGLFSNFNDGIPISDTDRRYFVIRSPFRSVESLSSLLGPGAPERYFEKLFSGLEDPEVLPQLALFLMRFPHVREFHPNGRAPDTPEKVVIQDLSRSDADDTMSEVLEDGALGVGESVIAAHYLKSSLEGRGLVKGGPQSVKAKLSEAGFVKWAGPAQSNQLRWNGGVHRIWVKENLKYAAPEIIKEHLDRTLAIEEERAGEVWGA